MLGCAWSMRFKFTVLNTTTFVTNQHVWGPSLCPYIKTTGILWQRILKYMCLGTFHEGYNLQC